MNVVLYAAKWKLMSCVQTVGYCGNLILTKTVPSRFLCNTIFSTNFTWQQPETTHNWSGNRYFCQVTGSCQQLTSWLLSLCDWDWLHLWLRMRFLCTWKKQQNSLFKKVTVQVVGKRPMQITAWPCQKWQWNSSGLKKKLAQVKWNSSHQLE